MLWNKMIRLLISVLLVLALVPAAMAAPTSSTIIREAQIRKIVKSYIEKNTCWDPANLRIEFPVRLTDQEFDGKKVSWQVYSRQNEEFIGESIFTVRFYDQDIFVRELAVPVRMETAVDVVVSARPLPRDAVISRDDVKVVKKWFNRIPQNVLSDPKDAVGKTLVASVGYNTEITKMMLKTTRLVLRGALVKVLAETGSLVITTVGLSENDGGCGDIIRVKNLSSNKTVYAKVIDHALVRVEF